MNGRSLELFFVDGDPDGLLTAEVFNWTGHILSLPRTQLAKALSRPESKFTGVYILLGDIDGEETAYIGEGENIADRIRSHDSNKDWWTRAILITTAANALNKAHVQYLESRLVEKAKSANSVCLENVTTPNLPSINEADKSNMESFLDYLELALPAIRVDIFANQTRASNVTESKDKETTKFELMLKKENIRATAVLIGSDFIVEKGSLARFEWIGDRKPKTSYWQLHDKLVAQGVLEEAGEVRKFTENYAFSSPSAAGAVVNGRSTAGPIAWKVLGSGLTYKEWEAQRLAELDQQ